ncbi:MAG: hypothetical protein JKY09_06585 [Crocinitomicaceae bacterium]|nr:hypothetical protein [Crocinitomicaceae bacterium]
MITIFFGIQQFLEGFVWLGVTYEQFPGLLNVSSYGYILFAWIIWPTYIPFTMLKLEHNPVRKKILIVMIFIGVMVASMLVYVLISDGVNAKVQDCRILYYSGTLYAQLKLFGIFYIICVILPHLISSVGKMWVLGIINVFSYVLVKMYFNDNVISVWCFFAAISSAVILWIISSALPMREKT